MLAAVRMDIPGPVTAADRRCGGVERQSGPNRALTCGEVLFQPGDSRSRLYRVERGALCHYARWDDGRREIIEFAFPGDIVGFGHLDTHTSTAQAMVDTLVSPVSPQELECVLESDDHLAGRVSAAVDRDFDFLRARAVESGRDKPVERLAALLSALSRLGAEEGRDPNLVGDDFTSGFIADRLDMTIDGLGQALRELERRGMVRATPEGLRISDVCALEDLARAA